MFKPYKTHDEIPDQVKKEICLGNSVDNVTLVPLKDINSFYGELDNFIGITEHRIFLQRITKKLNDLEKQLDYIEDRVQGIYDKIV
jgi:hypothetical protein|tara:strand:- start:2959 stop:3216 length:258 start_codon:yes stop_codon:yes gene_type:complete